MEDAGLIGFEAQRQRGPFMPRKLLYCECLYDSLVWAKPVHAGAFPEGGGSAHGLGFIHAEARSQAERGINALSASLPQMTRIANAQGDIFTR